jgi:hypothetical protein
MITEKLTGPKKAKLAIDDFEAWLKDRCKEQQEKDELMAEYQFQTGHSVRKLAEWMDAIRSNGTIKLVRNCGKDYVVWTGGTQEKTKPRPKAKLSKKLQDFIEKEQKLKEKMLAGPCAHDCELPEDTDCMQCSRFLSLKNKEFLEEV